MIRLRPQGGRNTFACVLVGLSLMVGSAWCEETGTEALADGSPPPTEHREEAAQALAKLLATPGLMDSVPSVRQQPGQERSKLFFEIGRCYYALGDSARAGLALRYAYALNPNLETTVIRVTGPEAEKAQAFVVDLGLTERRQKYAGTSKVRAAGRSLIFPGWGQMYRGHKKRGLLALGTTLAAGAFLAKSASDYNSAKSAYERTLVSELNLEALETGGDSPRPFETRYQAYESSTSRANAAAIAFAVVWSAVILDNLVLEPNRLELRWEIGR
jgi:hypothetical protein